MNAITVTRRVFFTCGVMLAGCSPNMPLGSDPTTLTQTACSSWICQTDFNPFGTQFPGTCPSDDDPSDTNSCLNITGNEDCYDVCQCESTSQSGTSCDSVNCLDLTTDLSNCGTCGNACSTTNGTVACVAGECQATCYHLYTALHGKCLNNADYCTACNGDPSCWNAPLPPTTDCPALTTYLSGCNEQYDEGIIGSNSCEDSICQKDAQAAALESYNTCLSKSPECPSVTCAQM
jgi:hypothetical protein